MSTNTPLHSWQFDVPQPPPAVPNPLAPSSSFKSFLGRGVVRPFQRAANDVSNASDVKLIRSAVSQILGTQCSDASGRLLGELPWRHRFGSQLYRLKHKKGIVLQELARVYVIDALARWEPRVQITRTLVTFDRDLRTLTITIRYNVISVNKPGNNVMISNIDQSIDVPLAA